MARHGKKPSEESTSPRAPRTLAGSATANTSADSTDAAASGIAVNSSTVSSAFASDADGNTGNTLVGNASNEVEATEVETNATSTNATSTNATGERTISSSNTAETSNRQSHESSESRQPQDLFDAAIAPRHQRRRRLDGPARKAHLPPDHHRRSRRSRCSGRGLRIHRRARIAANARPGRTQRLQGSRHGHEHLLFQGVPAEGEDLRSVHQLRPGPTISTSLPNCTRRKLPRRKR